MLSKYDVAGGAQLFVFDQAFDMYDELMSTAIAEQWHRLSRNYNNDILTKSLFMVLLAHDNEPLCMFGTQSTEWPGVARGFYRFYRSPFARAYSYKQECSQQLYDHAHDIPVLQFYNTHKLILSSYNINTVFTTRNYVNKTRDKTFGKRMSEEWGTGFVEHPDIRMYHGTPQRFYVNGDDSFLFDLPKADV